MRRQSHTKFWVVLVLLLLLAVVGSVSYVGWRQSVGGVRVTTEAPKLIGHKVSFPIGLRAAHGHIVAADVRVVQGGKMPTVTKLAAPIGREGQLPVTIEASALGLHEGAATIEVRARDDFWRPLRLDDRPVATFPITIDLTPPKVEILGASHYVSNGGVGIVLFRVQGASKAEIGVGTTTFDSFPIGPPDKAVRVALLALPYDYVPGTPIAIHAVDEAGNETTRGIPFELKLRKFPHDTIQIKDSFLELKVPELFPQHPPSQSLIDAFLYINRDERKQAEMEKRRVGGQTADHPLWQGPFEQPRNTKVFANFAETRTYLYQGRQVDQQVHFGYDLAATQQMPVPAANAGVIAFAGPLTIYGNAVIIDHGWGLQTLYGHLSSIDVKVGDKVQKAQELGRSGSTGLALGDHLHYEMLVHGISVTPLEWWDAKWVREKINLPLKTAGLPEIPGVERGGDSSDQVAAEHSRPARHRRR